MVDWHTLQPPAQLGTGGRTGEPKPQTQADTGGNSSLAVACTMQHVS